MSGKLARLALGIVVLGAAGAAFVAARPARFVVERSAEIAAGPAWVYGQIASLRRMDAWSPWVRMDDALEVSYAGPESGVGARSSWHGPEMGEGRLTVTAVEPEREVEMRLEMLTPMEATNRILFTLVPEGAGTRVTWRMEGENGFLGKALGLFVDVDGMVGGPFESGLAALAALAEADARERSAL
jgi:hypothetical protein